MPSHASGLTLDPDGTSYSGTRHVDGHAVALTVYFGSGEAGAALERAEALVGDLGRLSQAAMDRAARDLLGIKNAAWLDEGEAELTADGFRSAMTLEGVAVLEGGGSEFYFEDGDLFWGHVIVVGLDASGEFEGSSIAG